MFKMRQTLLCVDDDRFFRKLYDVYFESHGYHVITVDNAQAALRALSAQRPDALVTDWDMPGMNGLELVARARLTAPDIPLVVCSARGGMELATQSLQQGAWAFVPKESPFLVDLERVVRKVMLRSRTQREAKLAEAERSALPMVT